MKKTRDGHRFSKRITITYETPEEIAEHFTAALQRAAPVPFRETVAELVAECRALLEVGGLPSYERDSVEDLAARIIVLAERWLPQATNESRDQLIFELGQLATLAKVRNIETYHGNKGARKPNLDLDERLFARFVELRPKVRTDGSAHEKMAPEFELTADAIEARLRRMKKVSTKPGNVEKS